MGAGPTGLTLAIELARRGVPFRIIDQEAERPTTSRALGTQPRTVEVFSLMGIPRTALQPAVMLRSFQFKAGGRTLAQATFATGPRGGQTPPLIMNEADTERVLEERLEGYGGRVERGVALQRFRLDGDRVVASLSGPDGLSDYAARFLVGCDGANSTVRREAGIGFTGGSYPERFLLADLDLDWEMPHDVGTVWLGDEAGLTVAVPLPSERRWRVIVALPPSQSDAIGYAEQEAAARAEEALRQRAGVPLRRIGDAWWGSSFHIHRKLADRYRSGPVFLAGDAAHVHSPVGGQGMNTGIQDAFNLGWKLALAASGQAAPGLLDTYGTERRPVARAVLRGTDLGTRIVLGATPIGRFVRERMLPIVTRVPPLRNRLLAAVSELGISYRGSPLSISGDGAESTHRRAGRWRRGLHAGDRVPDATLLARESREPVSVFNLIAQGWTLLLFPGDRADPETIAELERLAQQVREAVGEAVQPYLVLETAPDSDGDTPVLLDPNREVDRIFGARDGLAALVRPDGRLGYRGRPDQAGELASYLARVFAMRLRDAEPGRETIPERAGAAENG